MNLVSKPVACSSLVPIFDHHCQLGHPSIFVLKVMVPDSSQIEYLECKSCQLEASSNVLS